MPTIARTSQEQLLSRRGFLRAGTLSVGGLCLGDLRRLEAREAGSGKSRAVIMIYLPGGPSHLDMYDLKPKAPAETRGEFKPIQTNVSGMEICELMPQQAKIADQLAIVRNLQFPSAAHVTGRFGVFSPVAFGANLSTNPKDKRPVFGATVSRLQGSKSAGVPPYVALRGQGPNIDPEDPVHLGAAHRPFTPDGQALQNIRLARGITSDRLQDRKALLRSFDNLRRDVESSDDDALAAASASTAQALELLSSDRVRAAFDLSQEPVKNKEKYGLGGGANAKLSSLLTARRLVEAGVSVVTLSAAPLPIPGCFGPWDSHKNNFKALRQMLPPLDAAIYGLVTDLRERGLDKDVAVVLWGEFGRTPQINKDAGRDHWTSAGFALLAGGGLQMGQVIGATDERGARPVGSRCTPQNIFATLYRALGIDPAQALPDQTGRPIPLLDECEPVKGLL